MSRRLEIGPILLVVGVLVMPAGIYFHTMRPHPVRPRVIPLLALPTPEAEGGVRADRGLARRLEMTPEARDIVRELRALGEHEAARGGFSEDRVRTLTTAFARHALGAGPEQAAALRAKLADQFLAAVMRRDESEVRALGGGFRESAERAGMLRPDGSIDDRTADPFTVRSMYKMRLSFLAGDPPDAPRMSRTERIAVESFVLTRARTSSIDRKLRAIETLHSLEPSYPVHLARGVLFARERRYTEAEAEFLLHRRAEPRDLRARNYLLYLRPKLDR